MTLKYSKCSDEIYREPLLCRKKEFRSSVLKFVDSSLNSSLLPADSICPIPASEDDFYDDLYVKKQRKMDEDGNMRESIMTNFTSTECILSPVQNTDGKSLSDTNDAKPVTELTSARDLCISILKGDIFPTTGSELRRTSSTIDSDDYQSGPLFECMRCKLMEDPSKMLICDCCEGAYHLSCCNPRVKKIPEKEWYCLICKRKKPKRKHGKVKSPKCVLAKDIQRPRRGLGPIRDMLVDTESYESDVGISSNFQADVPEWSGPILSNEDYFADPAELDPSEMTIPCSQLLKDKKTSAGNWIQCQEVLDTGDVCGKWRRAPLFVVQSSKWDCSCSVVWDPIHADCAVPQELETIEVLKQLKYINKLKKRLGDDSNKKL